MSYMDLNGLHNQIPEEIADALDNIYKEKVDTLTPEQN